MRAAGPFEPNHRILVIDDNRAIHDDLRKILLGGVQAQQDLQEDEALLFGAEPLPVTKFEIDSAYQGQEGLTKLREALAAGRPYAMAFVDIRMPPGWDGVETISRLWGEDPNLQVVVCTAYSDYSWNDIQRRLGQSENLLVLKKPFDNIEVIQLAHALTRKWLVSSQAQARLEDLDQMVARRTAELEAANARIQKQFEEKAQAEAAFRTVFEHSPIGIGLSDLDDRYVDLNGAMEALLRLPKERVIGRRPAELGWTIGDGQDAQEVTFAGEDAEQRTALRWARKVSISGVGYQLCFVLDISERKRMEEELVRARMGADMAARAKSEFLANMSHEIRTPLNGILGLGFLLEGESLPDELRPMIDLIRTSGEVLRRVLDDVLDFSKIESGRMELAAETFDLRACLRWSFELFRASAEEKNLKFELNLSERLPARVFADAMRLRQVTANLVSNAVKFTGQGLIRMEAELVEGAETDGGRMIQVAVRDTGIGIPEDRLEKLFQAFSQVDASTSRCYGGTGLGLAISKRLVEMMGGQIRAESVLGQGTAIVFTFHAGAAEESVETGAASTPGDAEGLRVLVAEDNSVNQVVSLRMLRRLGCDAELARDGEAAIRAVLEERYDIVLMDVHMPGVDGLEATRRIRRMGGAYAELPIVALTASATIEDRRACMESGMSDYLSKPLEFDVLRRALIRWGRNRAAVVEASEAGAGVL
jgi:PAS domain S-box-containing protein